MEENNSSKNNIVNNNIITPETINKLKTTSAFLATGEGGTQFFFKNDSLLIREYYKESINLIIQKENFHEDYVEFIFMDNPENYEKLILTKNRILNPDYQLIFHINQETSVYTTRVYL